MNEQLRDEIAKVIADNIAFRMAIAVANPRAYEHNRDELAAALGRDIELMLKKRQGFAHVT